MTEVTRIREDYKVFESEMNAKLNELKTLKSQRRWLSSGEYQCCQCQVCFHEQQLQQCE